MWKIPTLDSQGHRIVPRDPHQPEGKSPFYEIQRRQGAVFGRRMGWEQPFHFGDAISEHHRIRESCGLIDSNSQTKVLIAGCEAGEAVQRLFTNNMDVAVGEGVFSCLCNERGGAIDDAIVWRCTEDRWLCVSSTIGRFATRDWIEERLREWRLCAASVDLTDAIAFVAIQGPRSREVLQDVTGDGFSIDSMPFLCIRSATVAGVVLHVGRCGYSGELGYELYIPTQFGEWVWKHVSDAVHRVGGGPCGVDSLVSCGFEKGFTSYGVDYDAEHSPLEGGIAFTVAFQKPDDFVGRGALERIKRDGLRHRVLGLQSCDNSRLAQRGAAILVGGERIGTVLWGRIAHTLGISIGRVRVCPEFKAGMRVTVMNEEGPLEAVLASRYFYDRQHLKLKS